MKIQKTDDKLSEIAENDELRNLKEMNMKKYLREDIYYRPFSLKKMLLITLCQVIVSVLLGIFGGGFESPWFIISLGLIPISLIICLNCLDIEGSKYQYCDTYVRFFLYSLKLRKLEYSKFSIAVISNAVLTMGPSWPHQYKVKGVGSVTYPYITFHRTEYSTRHLTKGMGACVLYNEHPSEVHRVGICWPGSFDELIEHTTFKIYILEDVYLRFRGMFDMAMKNYKEQSKRFYIVTDKKIPYTEYLDGN